MSWLFLLSFLLYVCIIAGAVYWVVAGQRKIRRRIREQVEALASNAIEMTPEEFFDMRNRRIGRRFISKEHGFAGVYILLNQSKNMYYVGQGKQVLDRVNMHFTGKGNGDVYADYKYGDTFSIRMIALEGSGFRSLNELERDTIMTYNAYASGYNKTRGNR